MVSLAKVVGLGALSALLVTTVSPAVPADRPDPDLQSYVLFATQDIRTRGLRVRGGNVGVNAGRLIIRRELDAPSSQVIADTVEFLPINSCVAGELFANFPTSGPCGPAKPFTGPIFGPNDSVTQACGFPPPFACDPTGPKNITVEPGQTVTLPAGRYGEIVVRGRSGSVGTLAMEGGDYVFCSLRSSSKTAILFRAPSTVKVNGDVRIGASSFVGPDPGARIAASDIRFFTTGQRVGFRQRAEVHGQFCAPNSKVRLDQRSTAVGRIVARLISTRKEVTVFPSGTASPTTTTTIPGPPVTTTTLPLPVCGNGVREGIEVCDAPDFGGVVCPTTTDSGPLACENCSRIDYSACPGGATSTSTSTSTTTSTSLPASVCGNGVREEGEACDPPDFGGIECPAIDHPSGGGFFACRDNCTRIDMTGCLGTSGEVCGNCVDDDGDGLVDFEDSDCCSDLPFPLLLSRSRIRYRQGTSRLLLKSRPVHVGRVVVNPAVQDVFLQIRSDDEPLLCAMLPASSFRQKRSSYKFSDPRVTVASARGLRRLSVRLRGDGSIRVAASGRRVAIARRVPGSMRVVLAFRGPVGDGVNHCLLAGNVAGGRPR
jgi:hypothetical protein